MEKIVIIGGGIAGLTSLNTLLDQGVDALLLEGGVIGSPKMCGEFIAPAGIKILTNWNIAPIQPIRNIHFYTHHNEKLTIALPVLAGAFARDEAELQLAKRAKAKGAIIRENSPLETIIRNANSTYTFVLKSGEKIHSKNAIIATGRFLESNKNKTFPYYGIKVHFDTVIERDALQMHSTENAYFGIVPIAQHKSNFACLVKRQALEKIGSPRQFLTYLVEKNKFLYSIFEQYDINKIELLESVVPEFTYKSPPSWPNIFWIGDALVSLPPAVGYGFAHSVESAVMAANFFIDNKTTHYASRVKRIIKPKLRLGRILHKVLLNPTYASFILPILKANPGISNLILKKLGYLG